MTTFYFKLEDDFILFKLNFYEMLFIISSAANFGSVDLVIGPITI